MEETYPLEVELMNPLPTLLTLDRVDVLDATTRIACISPRSIQLPARATTTVRIYVIPHCCGAVELRSVRVGLPRGSDAGPRGAHLERRPGHPGGHQGSVRLSSLP